MRQITAVVVALFAISTTAVAGDAVEPEKCILDTLKGNAARESAGMVRFNCVRAYIRAVEPQAHSIPLMQVDGATLQFFPSLNAFPSPVPAHVSLTLKNNSMDRVILADIQISNTQTKEQQIYKVYADYPIDSLAVGTLGASVLDDGAGGDAKAFWTIHTWNLILVWGVKTK